MQVVDAAKIVLEPASHEDPKNPGVLKKVLFGPDAFVSQMRMLNWAVVQPGKSFQPHFHESLEEVFYIISGEGLLRGSNTEQKVTAGHAIYVAPGDVHAMECVGDESLVFLAVGAQTAEGGSTIMVPEVGK